MTDPPVSSTLPPSAPSSGWWDRLAEGLPSWSPGRLVGVVLGSAAAVAVLAFLVVRPADPPAPLVLPPPVGTAPDASTGPSSSGVEAGAAAPAGALTVHAAGAVAHPGVYGVRHGARVADVVAAAGGAGAEADLDQLNLAAPVADGERVWVPRRGEVAEGAGGPAGPGTAAGSGTGAGSRAAPTLVDLNRASAEELEALPGVGPATAAAIVAWRQAHGRFRTVGDLLEVRGIGPAKFEALRPLVRV